MKKAFLLVIILFVSIIATACVNNIAVQELNNKAKTYLDQGDYENAISRLKSSIDLDGTFFETHYNLGIAYTQAEKYPEAIETFKNAIKLRSNFADTYYSLAVAQENYANGIIEGTLKKNEEKPDASKDQKQKTAQEKAQIAQLSTDSITSYTTYLEKKPDASDKDEVQQKIEYLNSQIQKYSTQTQSAVTQ